MWGGHPCLAIIGISEAEGNPKRERKQLRTQIDGTFSADEHNIAGMKIPVSSSV
jgi:hypothetical protein